MSPRISANRPPVAPATTRPTAPAPAVARREPTERTPAPRADSFERTLGGDRPSRAVRTASDTYRRHGDTAHDLTDRAAVGRLISRSPQLDDLRGTRSDDTRCGGAAMFNAMLLDGNAGANAGAIEAVARARHVELSSTERTALTSMRAGHLTPHEAAALQQTVYRIADTGDARATGRGLTGLELSTTVGALRAAGGFPNTSSANFRMERTGPESAHWTVSSTTAHGTSHADSWPQPNGYATVAGGPGATDFHHGGRFDDAFIADVTMTGTGGDTSLRTRARSGTAGDGSPTSVDQMEVSFSRAGTLRGQPPPVSMDPSSGEVLEDL
jgi:hypothetical protein